MAASDAVAALWALPIDLVSHLRSEAHSSRRATYSALRRLYALSRGRSRHAFRGLFRVVRPASPKLDERSLMLVDDLRSRGIAVAAGYLPSDRCDTLRRFLESCTPMATGKVRQDYRAEDLLESPEIRALIVDPMLNDIAAAYLGCTPIFTQVAAWRSLPDPDASTDDLSEAAQLFHYDYDWPAFVKFFFYLSDVSPENGPFTYVVGTHERKRDWSDGRRDDDYISRVYPKAVWPVTGKTGDLIIADTVGYHKGTRVREGERVMLQLEFAVSRLGASFQYDPLPARHRPSSAITYDVFSA